MEKKTEEKGSKLQARIQEIVEELQNMDCDAMIVMAVDKKANALAGGVYGIGEDLVGIILGLFHEHPQLEAAVAKARLLALMGNTDDEGLEKLKGIQALLSGKDGHSAEDCATCPDADGCADKTEPGISFENGDLDELENAIK